MLQLKTKKLNNHFKQEKKYDTIGKNKKAKTLSYRREWEKLKSKKVGEIFSDYKTNSNIKYAEVRALNVIKKTNILQVLLYFDEYI